MTTPFRTSSLLNWPKLWGRAKLLALRRDPPGTISLCWWCSCSCIPSLLRVVLRREGLRLPFPSFSLGGNCTTLLAWISFNVLIRSSSLLRVFPMCSSHTSTRSVSWHRGRIRIYQFIDWQRQSTLDFGEFCLFITQWAPSYWCFIDSIGIAAINSRPPGSQWKR